MEQVAQAATLNLSRDVKGNGLIWCAREVVLSRMQLRSTLPEAGESQSGGASPLGAPSHKAVTSSCALTEQLQKRILKRQPMEEFLQLAPHSRIAA